MLAPFLRILHRARRQNQSRDSGPSDACVECEYSFYNHEANLPFDQLEECLRARRDALMQEHPPQAEPAPLSTRPRWAAR